MKTLFSITLGLFASLLTAQNFKVVAYMPTYRLSNLSKLNYNFITHVNVSFVNPDVNGNMSLPSGSITDFAQTVQGNGAKAIISIGGGGDYSWGSKVTIYDDLLKTQQSRTAFIHKIMNYLRDNNLDGLDNDMEGNALALSTFNVFAQELGDSLHAANMEYSAAFGVGSSWGAGLATDATLDKFDFVATMSYGGVGAWNWQSQPDDHTYAKMVSDMEYFTVTKGMAPSRVLGGLPFYTVEFPKEAQTSYGHLNKTICTTYSQHSDKDPFHQDTIYNSDNMPIYLNSIETFQKKMDYCNSHGGGIMIWEAGQDCFDGSISLMDSLAAYASDQLLAANELNKLELEVYPNPSSEKVFVNLPIRDHYSIQFLDINGQLIDSKFQDLGQQATLNIQNLSSGVYFIKIESTNFRGIGRITVRK